MNFDDMLKINLGHLTSTLTNIDDKANNFIKGKSIISN